MRSQSLAALGISAALVVTGVLLEGAQQNPWNLVMAYFLPVAIHEAVASRPMPARYVVASLVSGLAVYGAVWTLGAEHAVSPRAALVYIGLLGAVLSSVLLPMRPSVPSQSGT